MGKNVKKLYREVTTTFECNFLSKGSMTFPIFKLRTPATGSRANEVRRVGSPDVGVIETLLVSAGFIGLCSSKTALNCVIKKKKLKS
jgi:hypothetical protein